MKFVVIDDHPLVRQSMETALNEAFPNSIVKVYSSLEDSLSCFNGSNVNSEPEGVWWVLMDLGNLPMPCIAGLKVYLI